MRIRTEIMLLACTVATALTVPAEKAERLLVLQYRWQPGCVYNYETVLVADNGTECVAYETFFEVLSREKDTTTLAVHSSNLSDNVLFVSVADNGQVSGVRRVGGETAVSDGTNANQAHSFLMRALRVRELYDNKMWELPSAFLSATSAVSWNGRSFQVLPSGNHTDDVVTLEVRDIGLHSSEQHFRRFDLTKGTLVEDKVARNNNSRLIMRLRDVQNIEAKDIKRREEQRVNTLNADTFYLRACRPFVNSHDRAVRRTAYLGLFAIADQTLLGTAYSELVKASGTNDYFTSLTDSFLLSNVEKGADWAVDALKNERWTDTQLASDRYLSRVSKLEDLSGLDFGADQDKWSEWLRRVRETLPKLKGTETDHLLKETTHHDPWVRLFVLRQLSGRCDVDMRPILQKAMNDPDRNIQRFAGSALKRLR